MKKILYVVHRYAPYPGGSENYVRDMAEETLSRGHEVWVLAGTNQGDLNGVRVTNDIKIIEQDWDLIVVHGCDAGIQDDVLHRAREIKSPVLYMIILPSTSAAAMSGIKYSKFIGCSTAEDWRHVNRLDVKDRSIEVRHGIRENGSVGKPGFREKYGITTKHMFLSCGGYWPNKGMRELAELFMDLSIPDTTLVLTGYDNRRGLMPLETANVKPFLIDDRNDVISAISEADLYILHSFKEGFGLVLLESMLNKTPWIARNIAGAETMKEYGLVYNENHELVSGLRSFMRDGRMIDRAHNYVTTNHLIKNTVDDILRLT